MNYFDQDLTSTLNKAAITYEQLSKFDHENLINHIQKKISFIGSQIDWSMLQDSINLDEMERHEALSKISEKLINLPAEKIIFLGDSALDHAYSVKISDIRKAIEIFAEIPQHTYIFPERLHWIACLAFEGHIDYADLPQD